MPPTRVGAFAGAIAIFLAIGTVSFWSTRMLVREAYWVRDSQEVLTRFMTLLGAITDAETGSRGYVITGDESFLEPYRDAKSRASTEIQEIQRLRVGDESFRKSLAELDALVTARLGHSTMLVDVRSRDGFEAAQRVTASGEGKRLHNRIREVIGAMEQEEHRRQARLDQEARNAATLAQGVIVGGSLMGVTLAGLAVWLSRRDFAARRRAEVAAKATMDQLEQRVADRTREMEQTHRALAESEARLRLALEAAHSGTYDWDIPARRITWSKVHEEIWGFEKGEFDGSYEMFARRVHPMDLPGVNALVQRSMEARQPFAHEYRLVWPDGTIHWVNGLGEFEYDGQGNATRMRGVVFEVTARKQAVAAASAAEQRARLAMDAAKAGTWEWELDTGKNVWSNETWALFGIPVHSCEPSYAAWLGSIVPADRPSIEASLKDSVRQESELNLEWRVCLPGDSLRWLMSRGRPLRDESGRVVRYLGVVIDITERKQAEERALRWQRLFDSSQFGLAYTEVVDNRFLDVNSAFAAERGYTREELIGHPIQKVYPAEAQSEVGARLKVIDQAGHLVFDTVHQRKDGSRFPVLMEVAVIRDSGGRPFSRVAYALDISDRKRTEEALQHRNEELVRFIYTVSHDLKSPLVTIRTFLGYLEKDLKSADAERVGSDLGFIRRAAEKMSELLDEILELSRVGRKVNPPEEVSLQTLVAEALDLVAGPIASGQVEVQITQAPIRLTGDRRRLLEVFQNLIDNAVKFAVAGRPSRIEIGAETTGEGIVLFVRDNGIGIDPRHHNKLFGLFEKLHPGTPGTGIGLAIVKRIVEVHGGRIWAESAGLDQGTTFRFTLSQVRWVTTSKENPTCSTENQSSSC